ncbi:MAG: preprotein translocase subunit SecE [Phycisphaerales bacterium]|nr:preprotein translocase subunit SecE [Phycisphaerales bacterium]MCB9857311.1 preprotein translocase subunit SecE [Phycisphaerales bacterium]MCB9862975.1 preprotein translocase subunit SecE [Phycisphaerales bacterium]
MSNRPGDGDRGQSAGGPAGTRNSSSGSGVAGGIYKPGQGYYTRMWTAIGFGTLVIWLIAFLWQKLSVYGATGSTTLMIQVGMAVAVLVIFGVVGYRLLGRNAKVNDFLIATEGEMKKVNWTSRKEIIGSTKVVIFVLVGMSVLLFVVDIVFMLLFSSIGVLKGRGLLELIFGGGGS